MEEMEPVSVDVVVFGPNLSSAAQRKGDLHVHVASCSDCRQYGPGRRYGGEDNGMRLDAVACLADVVCECYPPDEFGYDPAEELDIYMPYFAPCVPPMPKFDERPR